MISSSDVLLGNHSLGGVLPGTYFSAGCLAQEPLSGDSLPGSRFYCVLHLRSIFLFSCGLSCLGTISFWGSVQGENLNDRIPCLGTFFF